MAAEGIHMTALTESVLGPSVPTSREVASVVSRHRSLARLGAVLVDLAYFERFGLVLLRHLAGVSAVNSPWGEVLHNDGPQRLLAALLARVRDGRASDVRGGPGREQVLAVGMGLASHLAVDVVTHPMVHRVASGRAAALGRPEMAEHTHVERLQSVLFHEQFLGRDLLGKGAWFHYVDVPAVEVFDDDRFARLLLECMKEAFGAAPSRRELSAWARGYRAYARLAGSPLARSLVTEQDKEDARDVLYRGPGVDFDRVFADAQRASTDYVEAAYAFGRGDLDAEDLTRVIPVQSIDFPTTAPNAASTNTA